MESGEGLRTWSLRSGVVQANTIAGWRYLDLTGVIVNRLKDTFESIAVGEVNNGTVLSSPTTPEAPSSIQFSPHRIVLRYIPLDSMALVRDTAYDLMRSVAEDMEVSHFGRLGFRAQYFLETEDLRGVSHSFINNLASPALSQLPGYEDEHLTFGINLPFHSERFDVILRIDSVRVEKPPITPQDYPADGISFDVDVFQRQEVPRGNASRFINEATRRAEGLLGEIGIPLLEGVTL